MNDAMLLQGHDLRKTYILGKNEVPVLHGASISVEEGSWVSILGSSGSGKSTLLHLLGGLDRPDADSGKVLYRGQSVWEQSQRAVNDYRNNDIGFVFQFYALYPHQTVLANLEFPLQNVGLDAENRQAAIDDVVTRLGIAHLLDSFPSQLSGGDQQRIALGRARVRTPRLYLMDEPLGTIDAGLRSDLRETFRTQQLDLEVTTVYVTHDQEEAMQLADRIIIMRDGVIAQEGSPHEVYDEPADLYVADFLGSPGMNLVQGRWEDQGERAFFATKESRISMPQIEIENDRDITLGVRPEHVSVETPLEESAAHLTGRVKRSEYRGDHYILHLDTPAGPFLVRSDRAHTSGQMNVRLPDERLCLFDTKTGRRLA